MEERDQKTLRHEQPIARVTSLTPSSSVSVLFPFLVTTTRVKAEALQKASLCLKKIRFLRCPHTLCRSVKHNEIVPGKMFKNGHLESVSVARHLTDQVRHCGQKSATDPTAAYCDLYKNVGRSNGIPPEGWLKSRPSNAIRNDQFES